MTYRTLQLLTKGLLIGDNTLPTDAEVLSELAGYALITVATQADSLHLMTLSTTDEILRLAQGDYLIRIPTKPILDDDLIDIDEELVPAVARYIASYVSRDKGGIHVNAAARIILDYNAKTSEIIDQMELEAAKASILELGYEAPGTEWHL